MFTYQEINAYLNTAYRDRADKTIGLLRLLLTLSATLLTALLPLFLFSALAHGSRICCFAAAICLLTCALCSTAGLLYEIQQEHKKILHLLHLRYGLQADDLAANGRGNTLGGSIYVPLTLITISLLCFAGALVALSVVLFQILFA